MRIALFSDIHANLPALEACLHEIDRLQPDAVYCLGDLVGYNIWPNEVIQEIQKRRIPTLAGNYDYGIGLQSDDCGCAYTSDIEKEMGKISIAYTNSLMLADTRKYLRTLPAHIRHEYHFSEGLLQLLMVHGSPRKVNEYLFEDREEKTLLRILEKAQADILCFGHTHKPYHRILESRSGSTPYFRHAINIGSVGKPKDDNPMGCFVLLTMDEFSTPHQKNSIGVEFIRFPYDVERATSAIEASPLPDAYAEMLRHGR